jgi:hypothetical protein
MNYWGGIFGRTILSSDPGGVKLFSQTLPLVFNPEGWFDSSRWSERSGDHG